MNLPYVISAHVNCRHRTFLCSVKVCELVLYKTGEHRTCTGFDSFVTCVMILSPEKLFEMQKLIIKLFMLLFNQVVKSNAVDVKMLYIKKRKYICQF